MAVLLFLGTPSLLFTSLGVSAGGGLPALAT
jgi:hypothetical protein